MTALFLKIMNMSISASWLVIAVLAVRFLLKKAPKWVNVLLWGIVAVRLICPISIESALSLIPSAETIPNEVLSGPTFDVQTGIDPIDTQINNYLGDHYFEGVTVPANNGFDVMTALAFVWGIGALLMAVYTAFSYWRLQRKVSEAVIFRDNIYQCENVGSPFVLGVIKPKIYLPYHMNGQDLEHVVAHERAHIRRKDYLWKPLGFLLLAIHWFNPLMWLAYILLCRDIELACDEKVIKEMGNEQKADYMQALISCSVNRRMIAACPLAFGEVGVKERVKSVMNYKKPAFWVIAVSVVACVAVAVCFLTDPAEDKDFDGEITWETEEKYPDAVVNIVNHYVTQQVAYYYNLGFGENAIGGEYSILDAKVVGLKCMGTAPYDETRTIGLYLLEYRLLPSEPSHVVLAGGMQMEGDWITEWNSPGQPYIALMLEEKGEEDVWSLVGITHTENIDAVYNTEEMINRYGSKYIAAAMDLYKAAAETEIKYIESFPAYVYSGNGNETVEGRALICEDVPENMAEDLILNYYRFTVRGDFDALSDMVANETLKIGVENERKRFDEGIYFTETKIHEFSTLSAQDVTPDGNFFDENSNYLIEAINKTAADFKLTEYAVVHVDLALKLSDAAFAQGSQILDGDYHRLFLVGRTEWESEWKLYEIFWLE